MTQRDPKFDDYVLKIHEVLDRLDYYRILGVDPKENVSNIKTAFYKIAAKFHPDRNRDAAPKVLNALYDIFKRLNEAYRVLAESEKRKLYDEGLTQGKVRLDQEGRKKSGPLNPEDTIKSLQAREFFRQALEELEKGNLQNADLHAKVAKNREPQNKAIDELIARIQQAKAKKA